MIEINAEKLIESFYDQRSIVYTMCTADKIALLHATKEKLGHWGVGIEWGQALGNKKNIDGTSTEASTFLAFNGFVTILAINDVIDALLDSLAGTTPSRVDFDTEYSVKTDVVGYQVYTHPLIKGKYILFSESESTNTDDKDDDTEPGVAVILGAGNFSALAVNDTLFHVFLRNKVCVLKLHPLQQDAKKVIDYILSPLIDKGLITTVIADIPVTQKLVYSPLVSTVHLTGGIKTHDALVWGSTADEQARNKAANTPVLKARMHSELGSVAPYIVCPGQGLDESEWTPAVITNHAISIAATLVSNTSCYCMAPKVLILPANDLGDRFYEAFVREVQRVKMEPIWYPGTVERYDAWSKCMTTNGVEVKSIECERLDAGSTPDKVYLPCCVADLGVISLDFTTLASSYPDMRWASEEPFAPVITVIRVPCSSLVEYASHAFRFANTMLWGNLSASVFAPDSALPVVMKKIAEKELYYGSVVINSSTLVGYNFRAYWGGPQGANTLTDAQSGIGNVGNVYKVPNARNAVVVFPFTAPPAVDPHSTIPPFLTNVILRVMVKGWRALAFWEK